MTILESPAAAHFSPQPEGRVFINAAYMSPKPLPALEAMQRTVARLASPDFGADEVFEPPERVGKQLARLVGGDARRYSLTGSASFGIAVVAWNLRVQAEALVGKRRRILGVDGQFPSNVQPWKRLAAQGFELHLVRGGVGASARLIDAIDERTALVATEPLSWTDGLRIDTAAVCAAARERGALMLLDVTQSAGVDAPIADDLAVDVIVGAGYKWMLGPYGVGYMRLSEDLQERLEPLEANWKNFAGSSDFNRLTEYATDFASPAAKFDHGESSAFVRLAGWEASLVVLLQVGVEAIRAHAEAFGAELREALDPKRFELSDFETGLQAAHLFRVAPRRSGEFETLSAALDSAGVSVSRRNGGWRLSPHVYNGASDVQRFVAALT